MQEIIKNFEFTREGFLFLLFLIPLVIIAYSFFYKDQFSKKKLLTFIDKNLLPHLLVRDGRGRNGRGLFLWSMAFAFGVIAMAGPIWDSQKSVSFEPDASLMIILDISNSMNVQDEKPSRLERARQEIEDLANRSSGRKIGIIAFTEIPHIIVPLTDDMATIKNILPSLKTNLSNLQGSNALSALMMAVTSIEAYPGKNKAVLLISDGDFGKDFKKDDLDGLFGKSIKIITMGVGTEDGGYVTDSAGNRIYSEGKDVISSLEEKTLKEISEAGKGLYIKAAYDEEDTEKILDSIEISGGKKINSGSKNQFLWHERFYIPAIIMAFFMLLLFRKISFPVLIMFLIVPTQLLALENIFKNSEQRGGDLFEDGEFDQAAQEFSDSYRRGVALYKVQKYAEAEQEFLKNTREEARIPSLYNLGNSQFMQQKYDSAIDSYNKILKQNPDHAGAKKNLSIAKELKEKQKKDPKKNNSTQENKPQENSSKEKPEATSAKKELDSTKEPEEEKGRPEEEKEVNADQWLNRIESDPYNLLKNQFLIKEKNAIVDKEAIRPW